MVGGFQTFFMFIPKLGEDFPILTHIFQMGLKLPTRFFLGMKSYQDGPLGSKIS